MATDLPERSGGIEAGAGRRWMRNLGSVLRRMLTPWTWSLPRLGRWRLVGLGATLLLLSLWAGVTIGFTSMHSAEVLVVEGGSIGIPPPVNAFDFGDVPQVGGIERRLTVDNGSPIPIGVSVVVIGGIRNMINIDDAFFTVGPGEEHTVLIELKPGRSAEPKRYTGKVLIIKTPWIPWP